MRHVGGAELQRNVLVDVNNLLYRAYFALVKPEIDEEKRVAELPPELRYPFKRSSIVRLPAVDAKSCAAGELLDMDVGLVKASLKILSSWLYDIQRPTKIIAFFDGFPARRKALFPEYKERDKDDVKAVVHYEHSENSELAVSLRDGTVVHGPVSVLCHVLRLLGCDVYYHPQEEADDLIATFCRRSAGAVNVIVSSDKDFFQLVDDRTVIYRPGPNTPRLHDAERVADHMEKLCKVRIGPGQVRMFKALTGDPSDGILGVYGLRKKVAAPLCSHSSVDEVYASGLPGFSKGEREKALLARDQIEHNSRLVGFYDDLDLGACLQPEIGDFALASKMLREDLSFTDADLLPFRVGRHAMKAISTIPDWLSDV